MKILYDINPLNSVKGCEQLIHKNSYVAFAICTQRNVVLEGMKKYLYNNFSYNYLLVWIRADDLVIENVIKKCTVISHIQSKPHGFMKYSMSEILFLLNKGNIDFLLSIFDQISSLEVYLLKKNTIEELINIIMHHKKYSNDDFACILSHSNSIINKSGDDDEIEMIVPQKEFLTTLELFL